MEPYEHRRSRPLHRFRYGWGHYKQHREGVKHGHRRRSHGTPTREPVTPAQAVRRSRRFLKGRWPREIGTQIGLGVAIALGVAFTVCVILGTITILQARHDLRGAQSEATAIAQDRTQLFTAAGRARASTRITAMQTGADAAANLVNNSVPLRLLSWIPLVGQQVDGTTQLVNDFDVTSHQSGNLLSAVNQLVANSHGTSVSLPALTILDARVHEAVAALRPLDRGSGLLLGPLASARNSFDREIVKVDALLSTGQHLLDYAGPFLGVNGPRTYLVAGENNAEMRDQGAVLSWALLTANGGTFTVTKAQSVGNLTIRRPAPFPLPPGTASAFNALQPTRVWQSVNATGSFPLSGAVMAAMYHQRTHLNVDGVIGVDVVTLRHLLEVTGPVHVPGIPLAVKSRNVEFVLLHGLYLLYPKGYEQNQRHDEVAAVASAAVKHMESHHYDLAYLVDQLAKSTKGRHLLVWSRYPQLEDTVFGFGASGALVDQGTSAIHLAVQSAVAAKLDWYIHTAASYKIVVDQNGTATISARVVVTNTAPPNARPHYIFGPDHINSFVRGQYVGRLDLWFPRHAITPGGLPESGLTLARTPINVLPGHSAAYYLTAFVPNAVHDGRFTVHFIPQSGLFAQATSVQFSAPSWSVGGPSSSAWIAREPVTVRWQLSH